ncbi:MAG: glycosyltransferase family 39 protein [Candidatus Pacebacteria bacterium]|nr:glycosyltransferase family 39 protein [Candidatus Paceibacterota bacterium]
MKKDKKLNINIFLVLFLYFLLLFSISSYVITGEIYSVAPFSDTFLTHIEKLSTTGRMEYSVPFYNKLDESITIGFTPRDGTQLNGKIIPQGFPYIPFSIGILNIVSKCSIFLVPLILTLIGLIIFLLNTSIFNTGNIIVLYLYTFFPIPFILNRIIFDGNIFFSFFFLFGLFFLFKYHKDPQLTNYFLSLFFLGVAVLYRYNLALIYLPLSIYYIYDFYRSDGKRKDKSKTEKKKLLIFFSVFSLILISVGILNMQLYGSFFKTGYQIGGDIIKKTGFPAENFEGIFTFQSTNFIAQIRIYILGFLGLFFLLFLLSSAYYWWKQNTFRYNGGYFFGTLVWMITLITFLYLGGRGSSGGIKFDITASFLRNNLIVFCLWIPLIAQFILRQKKAIQILFSFVSSIYFMVSLFSPSNTNLFYLINKEKEQILYQKIILENTEEDSIILTSKLDTVLRDKRNVLSSVFLGEYNNQEGKISQSFLSNYPSEEILAKKLCSLKKKINNEIYIANMYPYVQNEQKFINLLREEGCDAKQIYKYNRLSIKKLEKLKI